MKAILGLMDGTCKLMAELMYGAGLRVHECVTLHVKDIDLLARTITVRSGKGGKDRTTVLPELRVASQRREPSHSRATNRCFLLSWPSRFLSHWKAWIRRCATDAAGLQAVGSICIEQRICSPRHPPTSRPIRLSGSGTRRRKW